MAIFHKMRRLQAVDSVRSLASMSPSCGTVEMLYARKLSPHRSKFCKQGLS
jgi:hypothetical protein